MSLSDHLKDFTIIFEDEVIAGTKVKESIKEILFHKRCLDCKLNICNCGKYNWVVDINVIKEEVGEKLLDSEESRT